MGYCIVLESSTAKLPKEFQGEALRLCHILAGRTDLMHGGSWKAGSDRKSEAWFAFLNDKDLLACKDMKETFSAWRFECEEDENGITIIEFAGEKAGDEDHLFQAIGHLMTGELAWVGEDGEHWKDVFSTSGHKRVQGKVSYS